MVIPARYVSEPMIRLSSSGRLENRTTLAANLVLILESSFLLLRSSGNLPSGHILSFSDFRVLLIAKGDERSLK